MKPRAAAFFTILAVFALAGCDKNPLGTVETQGHPPAVTQVTLSPVVVYIDTLTLSNALYQLTATLSARVEDADGNSDIRTVQADVVSPAGDLLLTVPLQDDGAAADQVRGDGMYTTRLSVPVSRAMIGRFYPFVTATDASGLRSNAVAASLQLISRVNAPPQLSNLTAPDTLAVTPGQTARIPMTVAASDSDGLADVREVFFRSLDSSDPNAHFQLRDDGGANGSLSGDTVAGDGVYSIVIQLVASDDTKPRYRFLFQARDAAGDTSASILHTINITGI